MKEGLIMIVGAIGEFTIDGRQVKGVTLLDVVSQVNELPESVETIRVQYDSPGGDKATGKSIYNYLMSIKKKYKIVSEQIGMVGSIATMPWFAGDERIATVGCEFFIHNPWVPNASGDAEAFEVMAAQLRKSEDEMCAFYVAQTGVDEAGIKPLMTKETTFGAEQAVKLKFATKVQEALKIAAYTMSNKNKTIGQKIDELLASIKNGFKEVNMVVELEGEDGKLFIQTDDANKLEGMAVFTVDANGAPTQTPATDREYVLKGLNKKITVAGGKVSKVDEVTAAAPTDDADQAALAGKFDEIIKVMKENKPVSKKELETLIDAKITALKGEIQSTHTPPIKKYQKSEDGAKEWDRLMKENKIAALKRDEPEKYKQLFFDKYGRVPNM